MTGNAYGFCPDGYQQIIVFDFNNPDDFRAVLAANPHMTALVGGDDYTALEFPGVYIAGIRAIQSQDKPAAGLASIQK